MCASAVDSRFNGSKEENSQHQLNTLTKAIEDTENFFLYEKESELYDFLINIIERPLIENILYRTEGNQLKAAKILGINRNTLHAKIKKLKINIENFKYRNFNQGGK